MTGSLPIEWANPGAFRALQSLDLGDNNFTGDLPEELGSSEAFQQLEELSVFGCNVTGKMFNADCHNRLYFTLNHVEPMQQMSNNVVTDPAVTTHPIQVFLPDYNYKAWC